MTDLLHDVEVSTFGFNHGDRKKPLVSSRLSILHSKSQQKLALSQSQSHPKPSHTQAAPPPAAEANQAQGASPKLQPIPKSETQYTTIHASQPTTRQRKPAPNKPTPSQSVPSLLDWNPPTDPDQQPLLPSWYRYKPNTHGKHQANPNSNRKSSNTSTQSSASKSPDSDHSPTSPVFYSTQQLTPTPLTPSPSQPVPSLSITEQPITDPSDTIIRGSHHTTVIPRDHNAAQLPLNDQERQLLELFRAAKHK